MGKVSNKKSIQFIMILGIAGGYGLDHIDKNKFKKVYGLRGGIA